MKQDIGKSTVGGGSKMQVELRTYNRSTHDLSYAWRSSMGVGMLTPFMKILAQPGDVFNINMDTRIMTHPTVGPLFGTYKFQADIFTCPIRLYNAMLHNNTLGVGLDMAKVKLPQLRRKKTGNEDVECSSSSLLRYLGIGGFQGGDEGYEEYNAVPVLCVYDIFKNYYANKQEDYFYVFNATNNVTTGSFNRNSAISLVMENGKPTSSTIFIIDFTDDIENAPIENLQITLRNGDTYKTLTGEYLQKAGSEIYKSSNTQITAVLHPWDEINISDGTWATQSVQINDYNGNFLDKILLSDIDDLREEILSIKRGQYIIGDDGNCTFDWLNNLCKTITGNYNITNTMMGLPLKTYQSDIFNNWVNSEWIDGENGINEVTKIDTSQGWFAIDTLNIAEKVYNLLNRVAVSGGSYKDWIETVYTTEYYFRAETPIYEGGMSQEIEFDGVVSNAATADEPLGTLAGRGFASNKKGGNLSIKVSEPCYIIGIASITPRIDYSQGNDWDMKLQTLDDLHKPELDGIGFQDLLMRQMHWKAGDKKAVGKQPAWINYMTNFNKTFGNFAAGQNESFMCLNRLYEVDDERNITNYSTYINPKDYTYVFAENDIDNMDFWVQIGCGIEARRVMSAKQIPLM